MQPKELNRFVEKYRLAQELGLKSHFAGGTNGLEIEWNVANAAFRPLDHVGAGPDARSFVEVLRDRFIPDWLKPHNALEVFHWMTEWITQPYYHPVGSIFEARILEGCMLNAINAAGLSFGERLHAWNGNVLWPIEVGHHSVPGAWELSKRRYLQRCVDLFGDALATAGMHTNVSLPEPLFSLDFLQLSGGQREESSLTALRNTAYIRGARVLRAFSALFIATSANSPLRAERDNGEPVVLCTEWDSNRVARLPNPVELDVPHLYRSHDDYVRISNDLVHRRIRFGNNNWTPTRARSNPKSVENIIHMTSEQIHDVCQRGIYGVGEDHAVEQLAQRIETENMLARIGLPMARVELRSDEGGHDLDLDMANLVFRELLLIWTYANPEFGEGCRYDDACIRRMRRNEQATAEHGLRGEIEDPFSARAVSTRGFLRWALDQIGPLAAGLQRLEYLEPLEALASGAGNTAEKTRARVRPHCTDGNVVPVEVLQELAQERVAQVERDICRVLERIGDLGDEAPKLRDLAVRAAEDAKQDPAASIRFQRPDSTVKTAAPLDKTGEIIELAQQLIQIPSITNCPNERLDDVYRAARFVASYLRDAGVEVHFYDQGKYPAVLAHFPGQLKAPVMLAGHIDVVEPSPDDNQLHPVIDGDYLWGRGSADMKTVVATYLTWMRDTMRRRPDDFPAMNLLLVGNEENGEAEPFGTPHVLAELDQQHSYRPALLIAGERTGEKGDELFGDICVENRGVIRLELLARGVQEHTGMGAQVADLGDRIIEARGGIRAILERHLTLSASDNWNSDHRFSFVCVGTPGVYNITADVGHLGLEIRPIPQDNINGVWEELEAFARTHEFELKIHTAQAGIACDLSNPYLTTLVAAVGEVSGVEPVLGKKKAGTSARFAHQGQAVIWGQSGIGPHSPTERHYIPSIIGYYNALNRYAELLRSNVSATPPA